MDIEKSRFSFKRIIIAGAIAGYMGLLGAIVTSGGSGLAPVPRGAPKECNAKGNDYKFSCLALGAINQAYNELFKGFAKPYPLPTLILYKGRTQSACGAAETDNPFYCPADTKIYLDLGFKPDFARMFGSCPATKGGCDAFAFIVLAHEFGHHLQNTLGLFARQNALYENQAPQVLINAESVKLELQADCFAGAATALAQKNNDGMINAADIQAMINGFKTIGDNRILKSDDSHLFTHGSDADRVAAFTKEYEAKSLKACL